MFDKLDDMLVRFEEVLKELNDPAVVNDQTKFRALMKEQSELTPIVEAYKEYKAKKQDIEDSLAILEEESDEEMRELAKDELNSARVDVEKLEQNLKILLLQRMRTMTRMLLWKFVVEPVGMRQPYLPLSFIVCIPCMQKEIVGRQRLFQLMRMESVDLRKLPL